MDFSKVVTPAKAGVQKKWNYFKIPDSGLTKCSRFTILFFNYRKKEGKGQGLESYLWNLTCFLLDHIFPLFYTYQSRSKFLLSGRTGQGKPPCLMGTRGGAVISPAN